MESTSHFDDQMDAYLMGQMPEQDKAAFEARAEQDPLLAQQLRVQREIVQGLRQARMIQLKANLAQVQTPPLGLLSSLSPVQWIGGIAGTVALVAGGLMLYFNSPTPEVPPQPSLIPEIQAQMPAQQVPAAPTQATAGQEAITSLGNKPATEGAKPFTSTGEHPTQAKHRAANLAVDLPVITNSSGDTQSPAPPSEEPEDHASLDKTGIGALPSGKVIEVNDVKTKPEVIIRKSDVLSYQFADNKLYLYGSFGDAIYEVIELTTMQEGHRLYVFFKDNFYAVGKDVHEVTPMKAITDPRLVAELTLLRKRKVE